jgi:hypothetical protein
MCMPTQKLYIVRSPIPTALIKIFFTVTRKQLDQ